MKNETSKLVETANSVKPVVSGSLLDELLSEFQKYQEQIAETKTITDNQYRLIAKGIWGCKQIAKKVLGNDL